MLAGDKEISAAFVCWLILFHLLFAEDRNGCLEKRNPCFQQQFCKIFMIILGCTNIF